MWWKDPKEILAQETRGRDALAGTSKVKLPTQGTTGPEPEAECAELGIKLGAPVQGDKLFREAVLPEGWRLEPSDEDHRTTNLLDKSGSVRGYVWYKAASYDRDAYFVLFRRYEIRHLYLREPTDLGVQIAILDRHTQENVWESAVIPNPVPSASRPVWDEFDSAQDEAKAEAVRWLDEHYQDWKSPAAYWP